MLRYRTHVILYRGALIDFTDLRILKTRERLQNALLKLLEAKELKAITVKEICDTAGISRNTFYQHYGYKEDLYDQMVAQATERMRDSLAPVVPNASLLSQQAVASYARRIISGVSEVRELMYVMLKSDDGKFLRQLTDLIFAQNMANALSFFDVQDSPELRLYYEYSSAGMAAFLTKWVLEGNLTEDEAATFLAEVLLQSPAGVPERVRG